MQSIVAERKQEPALVPSDLMLPEDDDQVVADVRKWAAMTHTAINELQRCGWIN